MMAEKLQWLLPFYSAHETITEYVDKASEENPSSSSLAETLEKP